MTTAKANEVKRQDVEGTEIAIPCSHPGCKRCGFRIVDGTMRFRVRHDGAKHSVALSVDDVEMLLAEMKRQATDLHGAS